MNARMLCFTADCPNADTTSATDISAETAQQHFARTRVCNVESLPLFSRSAERVGVRAVVVVSPEKFGTWKTRSTREKVRKLYLDALDEVGI